METTRDAFLGGRLQILQPKIGYRAGADPVFLAAAVSARRGDTVLELGCGVGTALLCLKARLPDVAVYGIDIQPDLIALAEQNFEANAFDGQLLAADVQDMSDDLRALSFDHVLMNPPFFDRRAGDTAIDPGRETGRGLSQELSAWLDIGLRRLKPGGYLYIVNRIESLPECFTSLSGRVGDMHILPLAARVGRAAKLFVLKARKGAKGHLTLAAPFILHDGARHETDGENYSHHAQSVLREGCALPIIN